MTWPSVDPDDALLRNPWQARQHETDMQIVEILHARQGRRTTVTYSGGPDLDVVNVASARQVRNPAVLDGPRLVVNATPRVPGERVAFLLTRSISRLSAEGRTILARDTSARWQQNAPPLGPRWSPDVSVALRVSDGGTVRVYAKRARAIPVFLAAAVFLAIGVNLGRTVGGSDVAAGRTAVLVTLAVTLLVLWRIQQLGIVIRGNRLVVRGPLRHRTFAPADIHHLEPPGSGYDTIRIVLTSGRVVPVLAFRPMMRGESGPRGLLETAEINAWLSGLFTTPPARTARDGGRFTRWWLLRAATWVWVAVVFGVLIAAAAHPGR